MALYESEYTKFLREMRAQHPQWEKEQADGLALLWDRKIDREAEKKFEESTEPQRPYPYDVTFS